MIFCLLTMQVTRPINGMLISFDSMNFSSSVLKPLMKKCCANMSSAQLHIRVQYVEHIWIIFSLACTSGVHVNAMHLCFHHGGVGRWGDVGVGLGGSRKGWSC